MSDVAPKQHRRRIRVISLVLGFLSAVLIACAVALLGASVVYPEKTAQVAERIAGDVKVNVEKMTQGAELPIVHLGPEGGVHELDHAGHAEFIEMTSYRVEGVPAVYAAHNNRGGDVVLGWEMGQHVSVTARDGSVATYVFVEERFTPKWTNVDSLVGMRGPIVLQTCFYGEDKMRFATLIPLTEWEAEQSAEATTADAS